jgi:hypothetical protein
MLTTDIVKEIAHTLDLQAEALASDDFGRFEELAGVTATLSAELERSTTQLSVHERSAIAEQLRRVVEHANQLCGDVEVQREETRAEIRELRNGHTVMAAYRQALPREATLSYSRQG